MPMRIAHEVLHDCGLEDIYTVENLGTHPNPVSGQSPQSVSPPTGGGYYPPGSQRELITRLIMRSGGLS